MLNPTRISTATPESIIFNPTKNPAVPPKEILFFKKYLITASSSDGVTLEGRLPDQSALAGVLDTLFSLHLPLVEVAFLREDS